MGDPWRTLLDGVLAETDDVARETLAAIHAALPSYREVDDAEMLASLVLSFTRILEAARDRRQDLDDAELEALAAGGRHRARAGVPAEDMLLAWRIGFRVVIARARAIGARQGLPDAQMLEFLESIIAWSDRGMVVVTAAHHRAELDLARADQEARSDVVRGLLLGTLAPHEAAAAAEGLGLDPDVEHVAVRAVVPEGMTATEVRRVVGFGETVGGACGLSAVLDGDVAGFLPEVRSRAATVVVGVGPPRPLERLGESFAAATRALRTAQAFGLAGVQPFDDLGLLPAVVEDRAVGERLAARYVAPVAAEVAQSVRTWLAAGMHVERAAEQLFVHPNTLRYRLARFEEQAGASLKDPVVQFEAWWALQFAAAGLGGGSNEVRTPLRGRGAVGGGS